jgi:hypothetical protein
LVQEELVQEMLCLELSNGWLREKGMGMRQDDTGVRGGLERELKIGKQDETEAGAEEDNDERI